jgi:hypothetical protein
MAGVTIEAQDFYDNDTKMTFTCSEPKGLASGRRVRVVALRRPARVAT